MPDAGYRSQGQKPHSRLLLRYKGSAEKLTEPWRKFIEYIHGPEYRSFIRGIVGHDEFELRLAWHRGRTGEDIGPHTDSGKKLITHLFYFNQNWEEAWDGSLWFLGGLHREVPNPNFDDFDDKISHGVGGDRSILFKTPLAWHGVQRLSCPPGVHRRLFQVCARSTNN
jgi:hypothetical protein